jgi:hypothetical protein
MLQVDNQDRRLASVRAEQIRAPFFALTGWRSLDWVRALLARCLAHGDLNREALRRELGRHGGWLSGQHLTDHDLTAAGARAIAAGAIHLVSVLPTDPVISFDDRSPYGGPHGIVRFPSIEVARRFVADMLADDVGWGALESAQVSDAAADWTDVSFQSADLAGLLLTEVLMLRPLGLFATGFQLVWRPPPVFGTTSVDEPVVSAPPPGIAAPPAVAPPRSVLPEATEPDSAQIAALVEAAAAGAPFCEECARAAAMSPQAAPVRASLQALPVVADQIAALVLAAKNGAPFCAECAKAAAEADV